METLKFEIAQLDLALADGDFNPATVALLEHQLHKLLEAVNECKRNNNN